LLRDAGHGILSPLLSAESATTANRPSGQPAKRGHELADILAALFESQEPLPADGDGVGDAVFPAIETTNVAEGDAGVALDGRQDLKEAAAQGLDVGRSGKRDE